MSDDQVGEMETVAVKRGSPQARIFRCGHCDGAIRITLAIDEGGLYMGAGHSVPWCEWFEGKDVGKVVEDVGMVFVGAWPLSGGEPS